MRKIVMDSEEIRKYAEKYIPEFKNGKIKIDEIGDGNINYVYKATSGSGKTIILKKADKLLRTSGRPLDQGRIEIEQRYLIEANKYSQGSAPEVYEFDKEESLIVMEDISEYKNLRTEMSSGKIFKNMSKWIIDYLVPILVNTTDIVANAKTKKEAMKFFINPDMCEISEDLVLTEPYNNFKERNIIVEGEEEYVRESLYEDRKLRREVNMLKINFMNNSQSLLHGDLHSGSIFINENGIKIIDSEFAFYGPAGYDIGNVLAHYIISYVTSFIDANKSKEFFEILIDEIKYYFDEIFDEIFRQLVSNADKFYEVEYLIEYVKSIKSDSLGYMGTEIIRRVVGDTKTREIEEVSSENRIESDKILIKLGKYFILNRDVDLKGEDIIRYVKKLCLGEKNEETRL